MDPDLLITALVGIAGIAGTLMGVEWSARHAQEQMQTQWARDDEVSRRDQGKNAARAILDEVTRASELFDFVHRARRLYESGPPDAWTRAEEGPKSVSLPEFIQNISQTPLQDILQIPEWRLAPASAEVEPYYRSIRRLALEIADTAVAEWARHFADVIWNSQDILSRDIVKNVPDIGVRLVAAAEQAMGAYLRDEEVPELNDLPKFREMVLAVEEGKDQAEAKVREMMAREQAEQKAAQDAFRGNRPDVGGVT